MRNVMRASHPALRLRAPASRPFAPGAVPVYLFLGLCWGSMPLALGGSGLRIAVDEFAMTGGIVTFVLWIAWCLRGRGLGRVAAALEGCILFYAVCITLCLVTFVAGTTDRAFFDAPLAQADRILFAGLDWPGAMRAFSGSGLPVRVANWVYASIGWQPIALIVTLAALSAERRIWHFLLSWITTLCIVIAVFALYPVLGAYRHFGIAAAEVPAMRDPTPWNQPVILEHLHAGTLGRIHLGTLDGIINYPSFHAGAATLLAYGFWHVAALRWPFLVLNLLMLASAVPIGGHYIVDLLAGVVTAAAGIAGASRIAACVTPAAAPLRWREQARALSGDRA